MPTVLLIRHGQTTANAAGILAGWTPGVELDPKGLAQAGLLGERLSDLPIVAWVTSPLERCQQTLHFLRAQSAAPQFVEPAIGECHYGDWTGSKISELTKDPLWDTVQRHPSGMIFPGATGESLAQMQARSVASIRAYDQRFRDEYGPECLWVAVSHGDVIKAVLADAVGAHLDEFQRIQVAPASVSAVRYTATRPFVIRVNQQGGDLADLQMSVDPGANSSGDAVVGGGV